MQISLDLLAMGTRQSLIRDYRSLNATTRSLLATVGLHAAGAVTGGTSLAEIAQAEADTVSLAITTANRSLAMNDTADAALADIHEKLATMRDLVEDAALTEHTAGELEALNDEYQALAEEVTDILADTEYEGTELFNVYGAPVTLDLDDVTDLDLRDLPDGAMSTLSLAMVDVTAARGDLEISTRQLGLSIEDLTDHADEVADFGWRVSSAETALAIVESVTNDLLESFSQAVTTQANSSPWTAVQLLW